MGISTTDKPYFFDSSLAARNTASSMDMESTVFVILPAVSRREITRYSPCLRGVSVAERSTGSALSTIRSAGMPMDRSTSREISSRTLI